MPCDILPGGVIACSRGRRRANCDSPGCTSAHVALCDWPLKGDKAGRTCDRKMCGRHRHPVGSDRDYCNAHYVLDEHRKKEAARGK